LKPDGPSPSARQHQWTMHRWALLRNLQPLQSSLADVVQWLVEPGTKQQLGALGYKPQKLQQQLQGIAELLLSVSSTLPASVTMPDSCSAALAGLRAAQKQLKAAGSVLASFAIRQACNNPACSNMGGPSEVQLVNGPSTKCGRCRTARYCGAACQRAAWPQHKAVCKSLEAAAAAAKAATAAAAAAQASVGGVQGSIS
jgi:hypothetical protein